MKYPNLLALTLICLSLSFCTNKPAETSTSNAQADSTKMDVSALHTDTLIPKDIFAKDDNNISEISFGGINTTLFADQVYLPQIQNSRETKSPLIITYNENDSIISINPKVGEKALPVALPKRGLSKPSSVNDKQLTPLIPYISKDSIRILFDYFKSITCQNKTCADGNICLTFKYKTNGCFARAHWMKKVIEDDNHYHSNKIFSFGRLRVNNTSECDKRCVNWGWHVAPIVFTQNGAKTDTTVIDPSISDTPLSIPAWLNLQKVPCKRGGSVSEYEIVTSDHYSYDGDYIYDTPDYAYTKSFLNGICGFCAKVTK